MNLSDIEALLIAALPSLTSIIGAIVVFIRSNLKQSKFVQEVAKRTDHQDLVSINAELSAKMDKLIEQNAALNRKYNRLEKELKKIHTTEGEGDGTINNY